MSDGDQQYDNTVSTACIPGQTHESCDRSQQTDSGELLKNVFEWFDEYASQEGLTKFDAIDDLAERIFLLPIDFPDHEGGVILPYLWDNISSQPIGYSLEGAYNRYLIFKNEIENIGSNVGLCEWLFGEGNKYCWINDNFIQNAGELLNITRQEFEESSLFNEFKSKLSLRGLFNFENITSYVDSIKNSTSIIKKLWLGKYERNSDPQDYLRNQYSGWIKNIDYEENGHQFRIMSIYRSGALFSIFRCDNQRSVWLDYSHISITFHGGNPGLYLPYSENPPQVMYAGNPPGVPPSTWSGIISRGTNTVGGRDQASESFVDVFIYAFSQLYNVVSSGTRTEIITQIREVWNNYDFLDLGVPNLTPKRPSNEPINTQSYSIVVNYSLTDVIENLCKTNLIWNTGGPNLMYWKYGEIFELVWAVAGALIPPVAVRTIIIKIIAFIIERFTDVPIPTDMRDLMVTFGINSISDAERPYEMYPSNYGVGTNIPIFTDRTDNYNTMQLRNLKKVESALDSVRDEYTAQGMRIKTSFGNVVEIGYEDYNDLGYIDHLHDDNILNPRRNPVKCFTSESSGKIPWLMIYNPFNQILFWYAEGESQHIMTFRYESDIDHLLNTIEGEKMNGNFGFVNNS